jgi:hypothetical protein
MEWEPIKEKEMSRRMKILGLTLVAFWAMTAFWASAASAVESTLLKNPLSAGGETASLLFAGAFTALCALGIGKSQFSLNTLLARDHITVNRTNQFAINTGTLTSQQRGAAFTTRDLPTASDDVDAHTIAQPTTRLPNLKERNAWTFNPSMVC